MSKDTLARRSLVHDEIIGARVRYLRIRQGFSQKELGRLLGIARSTQRYKAAKSKDDDDSLRLALIRFA